MFKNILLMTDSYKASHFLQYPEGTEYVSSYIESRGGKWDRTVMFGMQMFLLEFMGTQITPEMIDEAELVWNAHGEPFNRAGWEHILNKHNGFLPVKIEAAPEGTVIETRNILVQIVNTDPVVPWLTSFLETALLRAIWYPTTVATNSFACKEIIWKYLQETADNPEAEIMFKMHDFGARGVSSHESAMIGGAAHLVNFMGSDTIEGVQALRYYYFAKNMPAFSIPAAEHSTITSWGGPEFEIDAFRNMLKQFAKPGKILAVVSDSYDIYNACTNLWGGQLLEEVQKSGATVVVRPDSGDPLSVPINCILKLMNAVGYSVNSKGYKVLPDYFRVIQGDGITVDTITDILHNMKKLGLSASNIAFGQGGGLLQQVNRDTLKFAMKCSAIRVNGSWRDVYKDPITDTGKQSKRGRLALIKSNDKFKTVRLEDCAEGQNELVEVYNNGFMSTNDFTEIRARAAAGLKLLV